MNPSDTTQPSPRRRRGSRIVRFLLFALVCLVTLVALFYAIENWRGKRAWRAYQRDSAARGEVIELRLLVNQPIPDAQNFAATPTVRSWFVRGNRSNEWPDIAYRVEKQVKFAVRGEHQFTDFVALTQAVAQLAMPEPPKISAAARKPAEQAAAARVVLARLQGVEPQLDEFRAAASRPGSQYPIEMRLDDPFSVLLPHLTQIRKVVNTLKIRACAELAAGESAAAFDDTLLALRFVDSLVEEHFLISQLVRLSCLTSASQPIWEGIASHKWSPAQLQSFEQRLRQIDFPSAFQRSCRLERAASLATIDTMRQRPKYVALLQGEGETSFSTVGARVMPSGWFYFEQANFGRLFDSVLLNSAAKPFDPLALRQSAEHLNERLGRSGLAAIWKHEIAARMFLPALSKVALRFGAGQTLAEQAATACALERFRIATGAYPETLTQLVPQYLQAPPYDLFARAPMKYQRTGTNGFLLYSFGANGKDDGATPGKNLLDDQGDWLWRCPE